MATKETPIRKRLKRSTDEMLDDDPYEHTVSPRKKTKKVITFDDVHKKKVASTDIQAKRIEKVRKLQNNELQCIMEQGTYVQCCDCSKWR